MDKYHRTVIEDRVNEWPVHYTDAYWCVGSCFAQHLHGYLSGLKFDWVSHPFGIVYNPLSIADQISQIIESRLYTREDLDCVGDLWSSAMHHGRYNNVDPELMLSKINADIGTIHSRLSSLQGILITLGTSMIYHDRQSGRDVSNCHKRPADMFDKRMCSIDEMCEDLIDGLLKLKDINPKVKIIISVSPVRHIKNGLIVDQRSKASLLMVAHRICDYFDSAVYFPAYDIMMNDLRDYRYYARDMIHPSEQAVDYILDYFSRQFFDRETKAYVHTVGKLKAELNHRPIHRHSKKYADFKSELLGKLMAIKRKYPQVNFQNEINELKGAI